MKIILTQDIKGIGKKDEVKDVADGYAKNFLFKNNMAVLATESELMKLRTRQGSNSYREQKEREAAIDLANKISGQQIKIKAKYGENGKIFGSVTSKELVEELIKLDINIDKRKIELKEPIKNTGVYKIVVKLYPQITSEFIVEII